MPHSHQGLNTFKNYLVKHHTGKHVCYAEELRRGARQFTPISVVFHAAFWRVQSLAWRKSKTFKKNVSCSISKINNHCFDKYFCAIRCLWFCLFRGLALEFSSPYPFSFPVDTSLVIGGFHLTHRHASKKNKVLNHSTDKVKKLICCRRVIHKRVKATGLCDIS